MDIAIVGRKLPDNENLGVGYLLAAAHEAGYRAEMVVLNEWSDLVSAASRIQELRPKLIGLSMPDGVSAILPLSLGGLLQSDGYRGHITAGGAFATLARDWLLERYEWLDSVVRFAGEGPLVRLARELAHSNPVLTHVAGLTTRDGDGAPAPVMDTTMLETWPEHGELPELAGHRMAHIAATRGCPGRCAYCGPAALQQLEQNEARCAGIDTKKLSLAGVGGVRRRSIETVCDEMAHLWHERDVRYFYFVDEHLLPHRESEAIPYLDAWRTGLAKREVGRFGIGCMLRADYLSEPILRKFIDVGLVRVFLGIELLLPEERALFSRPGSFEDGLSILDTLERLGVSASCNLMLVHPYSTPSLLEQGIERLGTLGALPYEATQIEVYHGTNLQLRLEREGRLLGNPLRYGTTFDDPVVERFADLFDCLRREAFGDYSLTCRHHDAALVTALVARLRPEWDRTDAWGRIAAASAKSNRLRTAAYADALRLAREGADDEAGDRLLDEARRGSGVIARELDDLHRSVLNEMCPRTVPFTPMWSASRAIRICLAGVGLAACQEAAPPETPESHAPVSVAPVQSAPPTPVASGTDSEPEPVMSGPIGPCSEGLMFATIDKVEAILREAEPCDNRAVKFKGGATPRIEMEPSSAADNKIDQEIRARLSPEELACMFERAGMAETLGRGVHQEGEVTQAVDGCDRDTDVEVRLNARGVVSLVVVKGPHPARVRACVMQALKGLKFACLAGRSIRRPKPRRIPSHVIME